MIDFWTNFADPRPERRGLRIDTVLDIVSKCVSESTDADGGLLG
jgi:hypothetical protein